MTIICAIGTATPSRTPSDPVSLGYLVTHPTRPGPLALWADPDLNGMRWKGQGLP